jgi:flagellin-like hook-associated protein FlgL
MRVTFNAFPDTLLGRLQSLGSEQNKSLTQLSTGQRISAPSDDAPAMQRILNLRTEKKQNQQFHRNATDGLERSKVTFSSLEQIKDLLVRASELAAGINGTTSGQDFKAKSSEVNQLILQGVNVANTKLRGSSLLSGDKTLNESFKPILDSSGNITAVAYNGSDQSPELRIGEGNTSRLAVGTTAHENGSIAGLLNEMIRLKESMSELSATKVQQIRTSGGEKTNFIDPLGPIKNFEDVSSDFGDKFDLGLTEIEYNYDTLVGGLTEFYPIPETLINLGNLSPSLNVGDKIKIDLAQAEGEGLGSGDFYIVSKLGNSIEVSQTLGGDPIEFTSNISSASKISKFEGIEYPSAKIKLPPDNNLVVGDKILVSIADGEGTPIQDGEKYIVRSIDKDGFAELQDLQGNLVILQNPLSNASKFREVRIEYPNDRTLLPNPHDLRIGDKINVDFAEGEAGDLKPGTYYVSNIISERNQQFVQLALIPGGEPVLFKNDITSQSNFQRIGGLQELEDTVLSALSRAGTIQYRLETAMKDLETRYEATEQLISKDADIDFAEATVRLNRAQMAYQAAIQSGGMIQRNSLLDYIR